MCAWRGGARPVGHGPKLVTRCRPFHGVACGVRRSPVLLGPAGTRARRLKAKEFIYLLGLKPKPKTFGFVIEAHDLPREGRIEVARWLHPGAYPIAPLQVQAAVDQLRRFLPPAHAALGRVVSPASAPATVATSPGRRHRHSWSTAACARHGASR